VRWQGKALAEWASQVHPAEGPAQVTRARLNKRAVFGVLKTDPVWA